MYEFKTEGMTCQGCANAVKRALKAVDGNADVIVELERQTVRIKSAHSQKQLADAMTEAGYPVLETKVMQA